MISNRTAHTLKHGCINQSLPQGLRLIGVRANGSVNVQAQFTHHTQCHLIRSVAPRMMANLRKYRRTVCGAMQRGTSYCLTIVTISPTTLAHKNHECEAPRIVPCHAQNLTTQGSGLVMLDEMFFG